MPNQRNGKDASDDDPLLADLEAKEIAQEILEELEARVSQFNSRFVA